MSAVPQQSLPFQVAGLHGHALVALPTGNPHAVIILTWAASTAAQKPSCPEVNAGYTRAPQAPGAGGAAGQDPSRCSEGLFPPAGPQRSASSRPGHAATEGCVCTMQALQGTGWGQQGNVQEQRPQLPGPVLLLQLCDHGRPSNLSGLQLRLLENLGRCPPRTALFLPKAALPLHCRPPSLGPYPQRLVGRYRAGPPHPTSWLTGAGAHPYPPPL